MGCQVSEPKSTKQCAIFRSHVERDLQDRERKIDKERKEERKIGR